MRVKCFFILACFAACLLNANSARAAYPEKTITLIALFSAGSGSDVEARTLARIMEPELGAKIIVKNVTGAGGTIGAAELSKAAPDGYTIGYLSVGPLSLQPQIRKLPYTPDSFRAVASVANTPFVFMVRRDSPLNTLADARQFILEKNGLAAYGSPGYGGLTHIASLALLDAMGVRAKHVPDLSVAEGMKNLSGDSIQFFADTTNSLKIYDVKALGIFADQRHPDFPDLPTMKEQGYDLQFEAFRGIFAPKGAPDEVAAKLEKAVRTAVNSPEFKAIAQRYSIGIQDMGSAEFAKFVDTRVAKGKELIDKFNLKQE